MKKARRPKSPPHPWEHALTCPLPPDTSYYVLTELRDHVLDFLRDLPHDFTLDYGDDRDREIQRAADRLKIISRMIAVESWARLQKTGTQMRYKPRLRRHPYLSTPRQVSID